MTKTEYGREKNETEREQETERQTQAVMLKKERKKECNNSG